MNDSNNQYQESQNFVDPNANNNQGYNNTYYDNNYNNNNTTPEDQKNNNGWWKIVVLLIGIIVIVILLFTFLRGGNNSGEQAYAALTTKLCNAAIKYQENNADVIDANTPGATAYITLKTLADNYLVESVIKDPRYKTGLFAKNTTDQYIPLTAYVRLAVSSNGEVYCEGVIDTSDDNTPPVLTLKGGDSMAIAKGTNFIDPGVTAVDDMDGDITDRVTTSGIVDTTIVGNYTITYRVADMAGNSTSKTRTVSVKELKDLDPTAAANLDTTPPTILVKGNNPMCLTLGKKYIEPGVTAIDNVDGDITDRIVVDNKVTGERTGTFRVTYSVTDTAGNTAVSYRSVQVATSCNAPVPPSNPTPVNSAPTISLIGGAYMNWNLNDTYIDRGATAWDKEDGDLTKYIRVDASAVDVSKLGIYTVYYTVMDSKDASTTIQRTITVIKQGTGAVTAHFLDTVNNLRYAVGDVHDIPKPRAEDSNGKALSVDVQVKNPAGAVISAIDFNTVGVYTIIYTATPTGGASQSTSRLVTIYDDIPPILRAPSTIQVTKRTAPACKLTEQDLINAGVTAIDNSDKNPVIKIKSGTVDTCTANSKGTKIDIYAVDGSGNASNPVTVLVIVSEKAAPTEPQVQISGCETYGKGPGQAVLNVGGTLSLTAKVTPDTIKDKTVTWTSTPNLVVDQNGKVTVAKSVTSGKGVVTVTTKTGSKTDTCQVTITNLTPKPVTGVSIPECSTGSLTIKVGDSMPLSAAVTPTDAADRSVQWTSSDSSKVTVVNGTIKGITEGSSKITVKTNNGGFTDTCDIAVSKTAPKQDTTPPTKVVVTANSSTSASDLYNKAGNWWGGNGKRNITLTFSSSDPESGISYFRILDASGNIIENNIPTLVSNPNTGTFTWTRDYNQTIYIVAVNKANMVGTTKSDGIALKLDNTGPVTTISNPLTADQWKNVASYTLQYSATDGGIGTIDHYEYTYDDVKTKADPKIEGSITTTQKAFEESLNKDYVYIRAVDKLGNAGVWTTNPSWLHMDTKAPNPPGFNVTGSGTLSNVTVGFTFSDGTDATHPKSSGFGKYTYSLDAKAEQAINTQNGTFNIINSTGASTTHSVTAWSFDNAGNKSTPATKSGIVTLPQLSVSCPKSSITVGTKIVCSLSGASANQAGVKLECLNGSYSRSFTTTSSDDTIYCIPSNVGTLTVSATKAGWATGTSTPVTVTKTTGGDEPSPTQLSLNCNDIQLPSTSAKVTANVQVGTWSVSDSTFSKGTPATDGKSIDITRSSGNASSVVVSATAENGTKDTCTINVKQAATTKCTNGTVKNVTWLAAPTITDACGTTTTQRNYSYDVCVNESWTHVASGSNNGVPTLSSTSYDSNDNRYETITWKVTLGTANPTTYTSDSVKHVCPFAAMSCTNQTTGVSVKDGATVQMGNSIKCTVSTPGATVACVSATTASGQNTSSATCTPGKVASNGLYFVASKAGYNAGYVILNVTEPPAQISCSYSSYGVTNNQRTRYYKCTSTTPGAKLYQDVDNTAGEVSSGYTFYVRGNPGTSSTIYAKSNGYTTVSTKICMYPDSGESCGTVGSTSCGGTSYAKTCTQVKSWGSCTSIGSGCVAQSAYPSSLPSVSGYSCGAKASYVSGLNYTSYCPSATPYAGMLYTCTATCSNQWK